MTLGPAPILALVVGFAHVCLYVIVRGSAGRRLPWLILAAFLGAWAGDALAARLAIDPLRIGDFHLIGASILAWVGIGFVAIVAVLGPPPARPGRRTDPESEVAAHTGSEPHVDRETQPDPERFA